MTKDTEMKDDNLRNAILANADYGPSLKASWARQNWRQCTSKFKPAWQQRTAMPANAPSAPASWLCASRPQ